MDKLYSQAFYFRYCHHLASVRRPSVNFFIFWSTPLKQIGQMEPNLAETIYIRSCIEFLHFVPFRQRIWLPRAIVSVWLMLNKSSPLKLLGEMETNLAGSIYVRSSIKRLHLVPFGQQTWPLILRIKHMVTLHVFDNNSTTVNNVRNLTGQKWSAQQNLTTLKFWRKSNYQSWSYCPFFIKFVKF